MASPTRATTLVVTSLTFSIWLSIEGTVQNQSQSQAAEKSIQETRAWYNEDTQLTTIDPEDSQLHANILIQSGDQDHEMLATVLEDDLRGVLS